MHHSSSSLYRKRLIGKCRFHLFHYIFADCICYHPLCCRERLFQCDECMVTEIENWQCNVSYILIDYGFRLTVDDLKVLRVTVQISAIKDIVIHNVHRKKKKRYVPETQTRPSSLRYTALLHY